MNSQKWLITVAAFAAFAGSAGAGQDAAVAPFNQTATARIQPVAEQLLVQLVKEGRTLKVDGQPVFNGDDKFLPGKIAIGLADFLTSLPKDDPRLPAYLDDFSKIARLTLNDTNHTWGIYYYLSALNKLRKAGELDRAVDKETLAKLKVSLDWRPFVRSDYTLINLPNNYYCVAMAVARLRAAMGWEDLSGADALFLKIREHYNLYSGVYGFADETDGDGRFDRYSVLLSAEITQRYLETDAKPPAEVLAWLRKSADVMMQRLSDDGAGYEYGRSLGPYADTAMVEVLTAAAKAGVLTPREKDLAYGFVSRAAQRYVNTWIRPDTGSVDLWDHGRRTDTYRGKFRILGENLSLTHQYLYTNADWNEMGYRNAAPVDDYKAGLAALPTRSVTWFARGKFDRAVLTMRDGGKVISLPLINGGASQHMHSPYFPIPFSNGMLEGVADGTAPLLLPRFTLADGSALAPLAYFQDIKFDDGKAMTVTYRLPQMDRLGKSAPVADDRLSAVVKYIFLPGQIDVTATYTPKVPLDVTRIDLEFGSFSAGAKTNANTTTFADGAVTGFKASGLDTCTATALNNHPDFAAPIGAFRSKVACTSGPMTLAKPVTIGWTITYK